MSWFKNLMGSSETGILEEKIEGAIRRVLTAEAGRFSDTIDALPKLNELQAKVQAAEESLAELKSEHVREELGWNVSVPEYQETFDLG